MIYLITDRTNEYNEEDLEKQGIKIGNILDFWKWFKLQKIIQLDTETNVVRGLFSYKEQNPNDKVPKWVLDEYGNRIPHERELYVVQIGDKKGEDQWLFEITGLKGIKRTYLKNALKSNVEKIAHNALFEYTIIKKEFDIDINSIRDTYLMSRILHTGLKTPRGFHGLSGCLQRYFGFNLDKGAQTSFTTNPLSIEQIIYAAQDVAPLGMLHDALQVDIDKWDLENVVRLECAVLRPYGDAMFENFYLDIPKWRSLVADMQLEYDKTLVELYSILKSEFKEQCEELGFIQKQDEYHFNWKSTKMKNQILQIFYPNIPPDCTTLPKFKKYIKRLEEETEEDTTVLEQYLNKNYSFIEQQMIINHQDKIKELNLFTAKGEILINFSSPEQVLSLFQLIDSKLEKVNKKALIKLKHPLILIYKNLKKYAKLITSYGENFIEAAGPDGMMRINGIQQILNTGRSSVDLLQLLPSQTEHRTCFVPPDGFLACGVDYASQELVVTATISKDERMLNALTNGYDLHSISASLIFPDEWKALGEDPNPTGKPKTKEGNMFRNKCKATIFGLLYGKSAVGLGEDLNIPVGSSDLMEIYSEEFGDYLSNNKTDYNQFCKINFGGKNNKTTKKEYFKKLRQSNLFHPEIITADDLIQRVKNAYSGAFSSLERFATEGSHLNRIATKDIFGRIRFFEPAQDPGESRAIERAAGNYPIQGGSSNMMKYALVQLKKYTEEHNLRDKVKFAIPIHDEAMFIVHESVAEEWLKIQIRLMEEAGEFLLDNKLQKAEGKLSKTWIK